jgi:hypothetical protein
VWRSRVPHREELLKSQNVEKIITFPDGTQVSTFHPFALCVDHRLNRVLAAFGVYRRHRTPARKGLLARSQALCFKRTTSCVGSLPRKMNKTEKESQEKMYYYYFI